MKRSLGRLGQIFMACSVFLYGQESQQNSISPFQTSDLTNQKYELSKLAEAQPVVLIFVSPYCPTSNRFMSEIHQIAKEYSQKAAFFLVHADAEIKRDDVLQHVELHDVRIPVLLDDKQALQQALQVKMTPEVVVLTKGKKVAYQGRINDWYLTPTKRQRQPTVHDLKKALEELLSGKEVGTPRTEAVGCKITTRASDS